MNRQGPSPASSATEQAIVRRSQAEYDVIPAAWNFPCFGAIYRLKAEHWSPAAGTGTAKFEVW